MIGCGCAQRIGTVQKRTHPTRPPHTALLAAAASAGTSAHIRIRRLSANPAPCRRLGPAHPSC